MKDKRKGKLDRHFPILINGHKAQILSYHLGIEHGHDHLTLKTLIQNPWLSEKLTGRICYISINTEGTPQELRCYCRTVFVDSPLQTYSFYILKEGDVVSYGEVISPEPADHTENSWSDSQNR